MWGGALGLIIDLFSLGSDHANQMILQKKGLNNGVFLALEPPFWPQNGASKKNMRVTCLLITWGRIELSYESWRGKGYTLDKSEGFMFLRETRRYAVTWRIFICYCFLPGAKNTKGVWSHIIQPNKKETPLFLPSRSWVTTICLKSG